MATTFYKSRFGYQSFRAAKVFHKLTGDTAAFQGQDQGNVVFDEFQQIYLEPEKEGEKTRGTRTILALAEKVGQAVRPLARYWRIRPCLKNQGRCAKSTK